jgi:hypothetical protein
MSAHLSIQLPLNYPEETALTVTSMSKEKMGYLREPESLGGEETPASASDTVPNGGLVAWVQVAGAFCIFFNTW